MTDVDYEAPEICADDIELFTEGCCHILANALNRLTGWPIHAFNYGGPDLHVFVVTPDGRPCDIEGVHDWETFRRKWSDDPVRKYSYRWIRKHFGGSSLDAQAYRRAREIAPIIVAGVLG